MISNEPSILECDPDLAARLRTAADDVLYSVVEFDEIDHEILYADEATLAFYEDEAGMREHFETIHSYVHLDFAELDLYTEDLFPRADRVEYSITSLDYLKLIRYYRVAADRGLFLAVAPDEPVEPLVDAIRASLRGPQGG